MAEHKEGNDVSCAAISKIPGREKYLHKDKNVITVAACLTLFLCPLQQNWCRNEVPVPEWVIGPAHWSPVFLGFVPPCLNQWSLRLGCVEPMDNIKHFLWLTQDLIFASLQYNWYNDFCKRDQWLWSILFLQNVNGMNGIKSNWSKQKISTWY